MTTKATNDYAEIEAIEIQVKRQFGGWGKRTECIWVGITEADVQNFMNSNEFSLASTEPYYWTVRYFKMHEEDSESSIDIKRMPLPMFVREQDSRLLMYLFPGCTGEDVIARFCKLGLHEDVKRMCGMPIG